jgi:hypothetical protein
MAFDFALKSLKEGFFDTAQVQKEADRFARQTGSRFGAYARRRMKSSLKYSTKPSAPGRPPHVHQTRGFTKKKLSKSGTGARQAVSPLRELIFFAYDRDTKSTVVGPAKFGGRGGIAPGLLEKGGAGTFKDSKTGEIKRGNWKKRPFVAPAGEAEVQSGAFLKPR